MRIANGDGSRVSVRTSLDSYAVDTPSHNFQLLVGIVPECGCRDYNLWSYEADIDRLEMVAARRGGCSSRVPGLINLVAPN